MNADEIRKYALKIIVDQVPWEIDKDDTEEMKRTLYYI